MITTHPSPQMFPIHRRMPVILPEPDIEEFVVSDDPPHDLLKPFEGDLVINPEVYDIRPSNGSWDLWGPDGPKHCLTYKEARQAVHYARFRARHAGGILRVWDEDGKDFVEEHMPKREFRA